MLLYRILVLDHRRERLILQTFSSLVKDWPVVDPHCRPRPLLFVLDESSRCVWTFQEVECCAEVPGTDEEASQEAQGGTRALGD